LPILIIALFEQVKPREVLEDNPRLYGQYSAFDRRAFAITIVTAVLTAAILFGIVSKLCTWLLSLTLKVVSSTQTLTLHM
jgi:hypothetical protein